MRMDRNFKIGQLNIEEAGMLAGVLVVASLAAFPLLMLLLDTVQSFLAGNTDLLAFITPDARRMKLLVRSLGISSTVAACGMFTGILTASFLYSWKSKAGIAARYIILATAAVPPYVHALSWSSAINWFNSLLHEYGLMEIPLQGNGICIWVGMMTLLPMTTGLALVGLESVERGLIEAGCIFRSSGRVFCRIVLPLAAPSFLAGGAFAFLINLMDYTIPSLFQVNVYSLEIFAQYSADYDTAKAFLLSIPLLLAAIPAALLFQWSFRNAALPNTRGNREKTFEMEMPVLIILLQGLMLVVSLLQFTVPLISLIIITGNPLNLVNAFITSLSEIGFSMKLSVLTACIAVFFGALAASGMNRKGQIYKIRWIFILLPFTIPAPLIGIAITRGWNIVGTRGAGGSIWLPVIAGVIRFLPFAALIMIAVIKRLDPRLLEASRIQQRNPFQGLVKVYIPMVSKGLMAALCLVFILSMGELGATLVVTPPGSGTITMKIYNYMHYGASDEVGALCLIMLILSVIAGLGAFVALFHQKQGYKGK